MWELWEGEKQQHRNKTQKQGDGLKTNMGLKGSQQQRATEVKFYRNPKKREFLRFRKCQEHFPGGRRIALKYWLKVSPTWAWWLWRCQPSQNLGSRRELSGCAGIFMKMSLPEAWAPSWEAFLALALTNYLIFIISSPLSLMAPLPSTGTGKDQDPASFKGDKLR